MKSFIIQRIMLIFTIISAGIHPVFSQENCSIQLSADIQHCSCINNGEIIFKLTESGYCQLDSSNIRYSLYSPSNSISFENSISPLFTNLPAGEYMGIVSALHYTGIPGVGANIILRDTLLITLNTSYAEPTAGILDYEFTLAHPFGKVRTLPCKATGIAQMKINGGRKPYTILVTKLESGSYWPYKTQVFDSIQHHGNDPAKMDYRDYYDIDSLTTGHYRMIFTDACGYTLPPYDVNIEAIVPIESSSDLTTNACNDNGNNFNIIYINDFTLAGALNYFAKNADYYVLQQEDSLCIYWKYRWIDPAVNGQAVDTSEWRDMKFGRLEHQIDAAEKYCDLWGKEMKLEVMDNVCNNYKEYTIKLQKPTTVFHAVEKPITYPSLSYSYTDSCGRHQFDAQKSQYEYDFRPYTYGNALFTSNEAGSRNIHFKIKDIAADTIIDQGIAGTYYGNEQTFRHIFEFDSIYHGREANFTVTDAKNCTIINTNLTISSKISGTVSNPTFRYYGISDSVDFCDYSRITTYFTFNLGVADLDTFQIINSPGQLSNMTMVYKADLHRWVRLDSNKNITIGNYFGDLAIHGKRGSGTFTFRYVSGCYTTVHNMTKGYNNSGIGYYFSPEQPIYKTEPTCMGVRIIPIQGSYKQHGFHETHNTPIVKHVNAVFKVRGNPLAPDIVTGYYQLGDTINISTEGDISIEMCDQYNYGNAGHLCHFRDTIIHCGKTALKYDYFYSYCCQISDTVSTIRTRAKGGVPPYLYIISDKSGNTLDTNHTGDFFNIPLLHHDTVILKVFDQCGTNFSYEGQIIEARLIKKTWFDNGEKQKTISDSSLCELFAITLDSIHYQWQGPNGFYSEEQNPSFFIPKDSNMSGKYYLSLPDPACGMLHDSLTLKVLSKNHIPELIWIDDSICSGKDYHQHGFSFTSSPSENTTIYHDTLVSFQNDSTFLKLTILPVYRKTHIDSIVTILEEYHYGSILLTDTGLHELKLPTTCGCDSTVFVHLMFTKYLPCPDAIDYNGNIYPAARLNKYCWTTENLKSRHYSDGRPIAQIYEYIAFEHPDKNTNVAIFGRLYSWFSAIDTGKPVPPDPHGNIQGICPEGWLLPTSADFCELSCYTAEQLRSPKYWLFNPGTNESGFASLPAGYYDAVQKRYANLLTDAYYWSCSQRDISTEFFMISFDCQMIQHSGNVCNGYSVRCIQK